MGKFWGNILGELAWRTAMLAGLDRRSAIFSALKRFPFWSRGHVLLSRAALNDGLRDLAYSSALAAEKLTNSPESQLLLARAQLMGRDSHSVRATLARIQETKMSTALESEVRELQAAIFLSEGNLTQARDIAATIPIANRSPEIRALLNKQ